MRRVAKMVIGIIDVQSSMEEKAACLFLILIGLLRKLIFLGTDSKIWFKYRA